ncbi:hypothetical protein ACFL01_04685 [Planctomycetota bacterium]
MKSRTFSIVLVAVAAGGLLWTAVLAGEAKEADSLRKLAAAGANVDIALSALKKVTDKFESGWEENFQKLLRQYNNEIQMLIRTRQQEEQQKPKDEKDDALIAQFKALADVQNRKRNTGELTWRKLEDRYRNAGTLLRRLSSARGGALRQMEEVWKESDLDLNLLIASYEAIEKKAKELNKDASEALADLKAQSTEWESDLNKIKEILEKKMP